MKDMEHITVCQHYDRPYNKEVFDCPCPCHSKAQEDNPRKYRIGDRVRKVKGSSWHGTIVGTYSTELTPIGYAVESEREKGSVQIYPEAALELAQEGSGGKCCGKCSSLHILQVVKRTHGSRKFQDEFCSQPECCCHAKSLQSEEAFGGPCKSLKDNIAHPEKPPYKKMTFRPVAGTRIAEPSSEGWEEEWRKLVNVCDCDRCTEQIAFIRHQLALVSNGNLNEWEEAVQTGFKKGWAEGSKAERERIEKAVEKMLVPCLGNEEMMLVIEDQVKNRTVRDILKIIKSS